MLIISFNFNTCNFKEYKYFDSLIPVCYKSNMEINQEASEKTSKIKVEKEDTYVSPLDAFKIEITEEPKRESAYEAFGYLDSNEFPLNTEVKQDEYKFTPFEEKQITDEESCAQEDNKLKIIEPLHSSHKGNKYTGHHIEGKILNKNVNVETGQKPYKCEVCFKQFAAKSNLKIHLRVHTGKKPYKCEICLKQFIKTCDLKRHNRVHTGEKPYKCETCFKQFSEAGNLRKHLRVHTGEKPHKCETCLKQFITTSGLKSHLKTHTGEKPHKCEIYFKQFSEAGGLRRHLILHSGEKP
ncbi:zinc finger protein 570-like isoform X9 [Diabrotica virgifera virgifera]|uniref:C2H2-type domain-containing protein n=1 Tax=Diabrotica virgifera virgifera TaxID=50390 RepID=A0ABM5L3G6_DIAVI|nr:zinc finger protein 570-like isoform X9 [Diabrotica virgifera virgifera]